jgi:Fe-Mn family superoxide dismutase
METLSRSGWLRLFGASAMGATALGLAGGGHSKSSAGPGEIKPYTLPELPYPADALEPHLDGRTISIHHDKHHAGYVKGLNTALEKLEEARAKNEFSAIQALSRALAFHGSGHVLHTLYFANLAPKSAGPKGALAEAIKAQFGSQENLQAQLTEASNTTAGSGWGVLAYEPFAGRLLVLQIEKHENQILAGAAPLLAIDVWEHAYYLKYQNLRADYLKAIWNVINWEEVSRRFDQARK